MESSQWDIQTGLLISVTFSLCRLILPYERYTKGEEDKPLPPIKPRKQEASTQEGGTKSKVPSTKRHKDEQNPKGWNEKEASAKVPEQVSHQFFHLTPSFSKGTVSFMEHRRRNGGKHEQALLADCPLSLQQISCQRPVIIALLRSIWF